jgi:hypothetical protein
MITKKEKIEKIINHVRNKGISAYAISKNTKLTEAGIGKILNKSSKNPRDLTVDALFRYLFNQEDFQNSTNKEVQEIKEFDSLNIDKKLNKIYDLLEFLKDSGKETKNKIEANRDLIAQTNRSMFEQSMNFQEVLDELEEKRKSLKG